MKSVLEALAWVGEIALLAGRTAREALRGPWEARLHVAQMDLLGVSSLLVVLVTALFTGMVLALQTAHAMQRYGATHLVGQVVALSVVREMGPVLTALMVGGRVGAGITAELGSMAVTEQVDALRALGASPERRLVLPRVVAVVLMLPALTVLACAVGIAGGAFIASVDLAQPPSVYWAAAFNGLDLSDVVSGVGKSFFFAFFVALIACYNGLSARGGADGVGRATTSTVVAASMSVLASDFFLTKLFLLLS